jgi:hypothetical protein
MVRWDSIRLNTNVQRMAHKPNSSSTAAVLLMDNIMHRNTVCVVAIFPFTSTCINSGAHHTTNPVDMGDKPKYDAGYYTPSSSEVSNE